jgi:hypothetical protein
LPFITHPLFVPSNEELSNDTAERRQGLLTLLVRQPTPKLLEHRRYRWDRRARGGIRVVAAEDMGLLLEARIGEFGSTATTQVSRKGRLWARSPHSVKARQWGHFYPCFYLPGQRSSSWRKIKPAQVVPCVIIGYQPGRSGIQRLCVAAAGEHGLRYVGQLTRGFTASQAIDLENKLAPKQRSRPVTRCPHRACWVEPELYCRAQSQGWTNHGRLRHAVFRGLLE